MKNIKNILMELKEDSDLSLAEVLEQIYELYVEETGDEDGENYDAGLTLLSDYADDIPESIASNMIDDLVEMFGLDDYSDYDDDDDNDEEIDESIHLVKQRRLSSTEKRQNKKEYRANKSKIKLNAKKWRKSAAGKKWAKKYEKALSKYSGKNLKGKRISID